MCDGFGVAAEKNMYEKKSMELQRATFLAGADGTMDGVWPNVPVEGHAREVLTSI